MKLNNFKIKFAFVMFFILFNLHSSFVFSGKKSDLESQRQKIGKHHYQNTKTIPKVTICSPRMNCKKALPWIVLIALGASVGKICLDQDKLSGELPNVPTMPGNELNTYSQTNTTDVVFAHNSTLSNQVVNEIALYTGSLNKTEELLPQNQTSCTYHNAIGSSSHFIAMDDGYVTTTFTNIGRDANNLPVVYGEDQSNALKQFENSLINYDLFDDNQMIKDGYVYKIHEKSALRILKQITSDNTQKPNVDLKIKSGRILDDHVTFEVDVYINKMKSKKPIHIDVSSEYYSFSTHNSPFMHRFHCFDTMQGVFYKDKFYKPNYEDLRLILQTAELFDDVDLIFREKGYNVLKYDLLIGGEKVAEYEFKYKV